MNFTAILLLLCCLQVSARVNSQGITLHVKNAPLDEVFREIKKQTGYTFVYTETMLKESKEVNIEVKNTSLQEALALCFTNQPFIYVIIDKTVVLQPKEKDPKDTSSASDLPPSVEIRGRVADKEGNPLPGVSVFVAGTKNGTTTNSDGRFTLTVSDDKNIILEISSVGYQTKKVSVGKQTEINVTLEENIAGLNDVVVIGYGSVLKSELGGASVSSVDIRDLKKAPVKSFEEALAGRVAGVQVTSSEGGPFALNNIIIRGNNSVSQSNSPLWVIDGFPIENPDNNTLDPSNIKSITVLKDAASTAIYGSRGANGVIVVTTNQGKAGAPEVTFDGYYGFQQNLKLMELLNPYEYVRLQNDLTSQQIYTRGAPTNGAGYVPGGRTLDYYKTAPSNNWQKMFYRTAPMQNYSLSLSGGTDKSRYMISGSVTDQKGTIIETGIKRYQGRFVFNQEINEKTNFNLNVNYANTNINGTSPSNLGGAGTSSSLSALYAVWGYQPAISPSSSLEDQLNSAIDKDYQLAYAYNPIVSTKNTINNSHRNNLTANAYLDYKIIKDLTLRVSGGINYTQSLSNLYYGVLTYRGAPTGFLGPNGSIANAASTSLLNENTLNYKKVFNKYHSLNLLAGFSTQVTKVNNSSGLASKVPNDALGVSGIDEGTPLLVQVQVKIFFALISDG